MMNIQGSVVVKPYKDDRWISGTITDVNEYIEVVWSYGKVEKYQKDTTQLLVYDIGPTGTCHETITCDGCKTQKICDLRWKCTVCYDFDLCSSCYHSNSHDVEHVFNRIDVPGAKPVAIKKRSGDKRAKLHGYFPGAKVKRNTIDWEWGNQDGGAGNIGTILGSYDWQGPFKSCCVRSGVTVAWEKSKHKANYRIGFNGKVDLICENPAYGCQFYTNHLPTTKDLLVHKRSSQQSKQFNVGDSVVMCKKIETLVEMQSNHGGFIKDMANCVGLVGTVIQMTSKGVIVSFDVKEAPNDVLALLLEVHVKKKKHWLLNPDALQKIDYLQDGDEVHVIDDKDTFILMQNNIGNYHPTQDILIGNKVNILGRDKEKLQIKYGHNKVFVSYGAVTKAERDNSDNLLGLLLEGLLKDALDGKRKQQDATEKQQNAEPRPATPSAATARPQEKKEYSLRDLVERQDGAGVNKFLDERPYMINQFVNGSTCLHVAVFNADSEIVDIFLKRQADLSITDDNGDTVLHIAASKNLISIGRKLVRSKCPVDKKNKSQMTAISVAVLKKYEDFVRMLVFEKCNTSIPDYNGDIPFHVACHEGNINLVRILLNQEDLLVPNRLGMWGIHVALAGEQKEVIQMIVDQFPEVLNSAKGDGATPLHVAVRNGKESMVECILHNMAKYRFDVDARLKSGETALHIACAEGFLSVIKLLIEHGADMNAEVHEGNTAVSMCVIKHKLLANLPQQLQGNELRPDLRTVKSHFGNSRASGIVIACYLLENGADLNHYNHEGKTALDLCEDSELTKLLCEFGKKHRVLQDPPKANSTMKKQESELDFDPCPLCEKRTPVEGRFQPCGHALFCYQHAEAFRKCSTCHVEVTHLTRLSVERLPNCKFCGDNQVNVTFLPCGHQIACYDCSRMFKICIECQQRIQTKVPIIDTPPSQPAQPKKPPVPKPRPRPSMRSSSKDQSNTNSTTLPQGASGNNNTGAVGAAAAAATVENENELCIICYDFPRNTIFQCGHRCCKVCAYAIHECHICRLPIEQRIRIYDN